MRTNKQPQAGIKDDGLYYTDEFLKKSIDAELSSTLRRFNTLKTDFEMTTGHMINGFDEFLKLLENPVQFYKDKHKATVQNSELIKQLKALNMEAENLIQLPSGFDQIIQQCNQINRGGTVRADRWTIDGGNIVATPQYLQRLYKRVYFYARTEDEKQRLAISKTFIDAYRKVEEHVREHYTEKKTITDALNTGLHANPLPYFLIKVPSKNGVELVPNPKWVSGCYDSTNFLGTYISSPEEKRQAEKDAQPKLGARHLKFRKMIEGKWRYFLIEESKADKYKVDGNIFEKGIWNEQDKPYGTPLTSTTTTAELYLRNLN